MNKKVVVWFNPSKESYYYRVVRGIYYESYDYVVGSENSYGHIIVLIIPLSDLVSIPTIKQRIKNNMISFLKKI